MPRNSSSAGPVHGALATDNVIARVWTAVAHHGIRLLRGALAEDSELFAESEASEAPASGLRCTLLDQLLAPTTDVLFLTSGNDLGRIAARRLAAAFPDLKIIVEQPVARSTLLRGRIRRLGPLHVAGQMAFMAFARALYMRSRRRIAEILEQHQLEPHWPQGCERIEVPSVNSPECLAAIERLKPRVILLLGTRIIDRTTLAAIKAPLINYHAGITPKYRGIHGGYWAKVEGDLENFGVTVHLVDPGIDTGAVLYQARLKPNATDNYSTFPYLQLATVLPLLEQAVRDALAGKLDPQTVDLPSRMWSHPTIWRYIAGGLRRGAW
jgi:folate-dependent phosphoribosylglycinamide formyltransferase PurN